jgi:hypothetical protein
MERLAALFRSTDYRERGRKETAKLTMHKELPGIVKSVVEFAGDGRKPNKEELSYRLWLLRGSLVW